MTLNIQFKNIREIRMGSPYNLCEIEISGSWIPPLQTYDWQDLIAYNPDKRHIALIQWNTTGNIPGFHVVRIDSKLQKWHKTKRIPGICKKVFWENEGFKWFK